MTDVASKLQALADTCAPRAWRLACSMMRNATDADDVLQQAFVVAAQKPQSIPGDDAWPWFAAVIANTARNARRKRARAAVEITVEPADNRTDPAAAAAQAQLATRLRLELAMLPEDEADAISLTQLSGLSVRQAAAALDVPAPTLNSRLERGFNTLRKKLRCEGAALTAALPLINFDPPPLGLERAAQGWLKGALAYASLASATLQPVLGGLVMLKVFVAVVLVASLIVFAGGQLAPRSTTNNTSIALEDGASPRVNPDTPIKKTIEDRRVSVPFKVDSTAAAGEQPAKPVEPRDKPVAALVTATTFSVSGNCRELVSGVDEGLPLAGATICVQRISNQCLPTLGKGEHAGRIVLWKDVERFTAVSDATGAFIVKDIPRKWDQPKPEGADEPQLAQLIISMTHPDFYCTTTQIYSDDGSYTPRRALKTGATRTLEPAVRAHGTRATFDLSFDGDTALLVTNPSCKFQEWRERRGNDPLWFHAWRATSLVGAVTDIAGTPIAGARVYVTNFDHGAFDTLTDPAGRYRLCGLEGIGNEVLVEVSAPRLTSWQNRVKIHGDALRHEHLLDVQLDPGAVIRAQLASLAGGQRKLIARLEYKRGPESKTEMDYTMDVPPSGLIEFTGLTTHALYRLVIENPDPENKATLVVTDWIEATPDAPPIQLVEPAPATVRITLAGDCFAEGRDEMLVALCPLEWFDLSVGPTMTLLRIAPRICIKKESGSRIFEYYPGPMSKQLRIIALAPNSERNNLYLELRDGGSGTPPLNDLPDIFVSGELDLEVGRHYEVSVIERLVPAVIAGKLLNNRGGRVWLEPGQRSFEYRGTASGRLYGHDEPDAEGKFAFDSYLWPGEYVVRWSKDGNSRGDYKKTVTVKAGETLYVELDPPEPAEGEDK